MQLRSMMKNCPGTSGFNNTSAVFFHKEPRDSRCVAFSLLKMQDGSYLSLKDALVHFYSFDGAAFMPAWAMNLKYAPIINELKLSWESATLGGGCWFETSGNHP